MMTSRLPAKLRLPLRPRWPSKLGHRLRTFSSADPPRPPLPPFTLETAIEKTKKAEDAWNSKDPEKVSLAYSKDSEWRNRGVFVKGRKEIRDFLADKWERELDYKLEKRYWCHADNRIAVRFAYEYRNSTGQWFRAHGNENWEFDELGYMTRREASINDIEIEESDRVIAVEDGPKTKDNPSWT
eukprot:CAMPEP_0184490416 /NCGR_PEP_ID=MMETSP0113_2-20130426/17845_1 /TAXON_ID=91329 /ORGANISM="Norrisiella sphaerica, Strain BC52" /LENGTH=183 /DNA_ID=CAMNT_0026874291 /DNA_START=1 /DNA_END=552 /DNA_ORIENTATION=+